MAPELPRYLQLLWNREPAGRRGPRPSRSITEIGRAATEVADREGLTAVTMKSVAAGLGMTTMSLYRYVDTKEQLLAVMHDVAMGPCPLRYGPRTGWRRRATDWAEDLAAVRRRHAWMTEIQGGPAATPNLIGWMESGLEALSGLDLGVPGRFSALLLIDNFVSGHVRNAANLGTGRGLAEENDAARRYGATLDTVLDPDRHPLVREGIPAVFGGDDDEPYFEAELRFGLEVLLDGLEARVAQR